MIGEIINNYILERKLGDGGMGDVYYARHNRVDRSVAIKVLHENLLVNESIHNRFKNEANALIKLEHPNIVKIYDYVEQENLACLIMEYIDGITLDDYINKFSGPLPEAKTRGIMGSVLDAVQYAHDNNIFHRDIKPGNIMVSKDGKAVKIMDFGIAKFTDTASLNITHINAQLGTPFYMSPEQVKGLPYSRQSDIYSLGVTLFEMLTGKCPYMGITNLFELQSKIVNQPLPSTDIYYPNVSLKLQEAIKIATNKLPDQRFKSCTQFKKFITSGEVVHAVQKQTLQQQPAQHQAKPAIKQSPSVNRTLKPEYYKKRTWIYLTGTVLLLIALFIYSFVIKTQNKNQQKKQNIIADTTSINAKDTSVTINITDSAIKNSDTTTNIPEIQKFVSESKKEIKIPTLEDVKSDLVDNKLSNGLRFSKDMVVTNFSAGTPGNKWSAYLEFETDGNSYSTTVYYGKKENKYIYERNTGRNIKETLPKKQNPDTIKKTNLATDETDNTLNTKDCKHPTDTKVFADLKKKVIKNKKNYSLSDKDIDEITDLKISARNPDDNDNLSYIIDFKIKGREYSEKMRYECKNKIYELQ